MTIASSTLSRSAADAASLAGLIFYGCADRPPSPRRHFSRHHRMGHPQHSKGRARARLLRLQELAHVEPQGSARRTDLTTSV